MTNEPLFQLTNQQKAIEALLVKQALMNPHVTLLVSPCRNIGKTAALDAIADFQTDQKKRLNPPPEN